VSTNLIPLTFDPVQFEKEIKAFERLLKKPLLSETKDLQPFFQRNPHLTAYIGTYSTELGHATEYAFEYDLFGDYKSDLVLANRRAKQFCIVEFEDGTPDSIFKNQPKRANPEWGPRFEHGFSQLVDWCYNLDDYKKTSGFARTFGSDDAGFLAF
jgi:hypothetical protein